MTIRQEHPTWQLLQVSDVLDLEFASALGELVPVIGWEPHRALLPSIIRPGHEPERIHPGTQLRIRKLPLMRGFARFPISPIADIGTFVTRRLLHQSSDPERCPLICTAPFFAPVAERWPGPVIYWITDLIAEYVGARRQQVRRLDRRMCRAATLVCPNSQRLQKYLIEHADCDPAKLLIVPNATRSSNILPHPAFSPGPVPPLMRSIPRPIAGVIGNLASNTDWKLISDIMDAIPSLSWVFVGPTGMPIADSEQEHARRSIMQRPQANFVGKQPYGDLAAFARAFDVAVLPYKRCEPTYSGSSTRFYDHLAACRPMLATRGLEELIRKEPLLCLVDTALEAIERLSALQDKQFDDGLFEARWLASLENTWQVRAQSVKTALSRRLPPAPVLPDHRVAVGAAR
jgi:hypothetical protein